MSVCVCVGPSVRPSLDQICVGHDPNVGGVDDTTQTHGPIGRSVGRRVSPVVPRLKAPLHVRLQPRLGSAGPERLVRPYQVRYRIHHRSWSVAAQACVNAFVCARWRHRGHGLRGECASDCSCRSSLSVSLSGRSCPPPSPSIHTHVLQSKNMCMSYASVRTYESIARCCMRSRMVSKATS